MTTVQSYKYRVVTMQMVMSNGNKIVLSQRLIPPSFKRGHYDGYIADHNGTILKSFFSEAAPKDAFTMRELIAVYERMIGELNE